jgi:heat shock protein HtpX
VWNFGSEGLWRSRIEPHAIPGASFPISFAMVPATPHMEPVRVSRSSDIISIELHLTTAWPGWALYCRIDGNPQEPSGLRRQIHCQIHRDLNHRHSAWVIAAMMMLLALCGFIDGGAEGAQRAVAEGMPRPGAAAVPREAWLRAFGARRLRPAEMPELFRVLAEVCRRAQLSRSPDLYYVAAPAQMNAYAYGSPDSSAIIVTEGLLRNMSLGEIAGILAHEVAHIRNQDAWAMDWAAALNRAIERVAPAALAALRTRAERAPGRPLASLLRAAPAIGRLLLLALSRIRELDADATALELTGDMHAMVGALAKLERHHSGSAMPAARAFDDGPTRFLRSHPETSERVGRLLSLAH